MSTNTTDQQPLTPLDKPVGSYLHSFPGGLKLRHFKAQSCLRPIDRPRLPEVLNLPLHQHIGEPASPTVKVGEKVLKGQKIATVKDGFGAELHAPSSGTIESIEQLPVINDQQAIGLNIVIRLDGEDQWHPSCESAVTNWRSLTQTELIERIRNAGIAGLGGAVFPTHRKLDHKWATPVHTLIINGCECEPYISCDEMLMRERAAELLTGAQITAKALGVEHIVIAIEDQMGEVETSLRQQVKRLHDDRVRVAKVPSIYPEGGERQLIKVLTGQEVSSGCYPQQIGLVCLNVGTIWAIKRALIDNIPLIERVVTVTGNVAEPRNWLALLGTSVEHLLTSSGDVKPGTARLVMGGPVMGVSIPDLQCGLTKAFNCLLALHSDELRKPASAMPCINCLECVRVCPARLMPQMLYHAARHQNNDQTRDLAILDCIECGCCDLVCPSQIPLTDYFRVGKAQLHMQHIEQQRASKSRQRHTAREQRLELKAQARMERRKRREERATDPDKARDAIAAALERVKVKRKTGE